MGFYDDFAINIYIYDFMFFFFLICNSTLFKKNLYDIFLSVHECLSNIWLREVLQAATSSKGWWLVGA